MPVDKLIQVRRDTAANWTSVNPILSSGEAGYETNTGKMKYGDGVTVWTSLAYFNPQTSIVGITGTKAQFDTAVTDGNFTYVGDNVNNFVGGNWKVFYTNGTGVITELALGASGTVLQSNGASSAPTFVTPSGGGSTNYGQIIPIAMGYGVA